MELPNQRIEWVLVLLIHLLVATGVTLIGVGSSALKSTTSSIPSNSSDHVLAEVGMYILLVSWVSISIWTVTSLLSRQQRRYSAPAARKTSLMVIMGSSSFITRC